jgi:hypothetical protein
LDDLSIGDRGVLKSPTATVLESICAFKSFRVCLMKLGALTLVAYRLIIVISFWCISPFISMKCSSLSHFINVSLNSTLFDIKIATPAPNVLLYQNLIHVVPQVSATLWDPFHLYQLWHLIPCLLI